MPPDTDQLLQFAIDQAHTAGSIMRDYFARTDKGVSQKSNHTSVTEADTRINRQLIEAVNLAFPSHGVLGEEASYDQEATDVWVCDPIDGTDAFIIGVPTAMFSLAFIHDGTVMVAVTYDPFLDRLYTAVKGRGAYVGDQPIRVSEVEQLSEARVTTSASINQITENIGFFQSLAATGASVKGIPGFVCRGSLVAAGRLDACIALGAAHDFAAVSLLVTEAGGVCTDLRGVDQRYDRSVEAVIISNGPLHNQLVQLLTDYGVDKFLEARG